MASVLIAAWDQAHSEKCALSNRPAQILATEKDRRSTVKDNGIDYAISKESRIQDLRDGADLRHTRQHERPGR